MPSPDSSPSDSSRRRLLQYAGYTLTASLAGCFNRRPSETATETPQPSSTDRPTNSTTPHASLDAPLRTAYNSRERFQSSGSSLDGFETLTEWESIVGEHRADTDVQFTDSQSLQLVGQPGEKVTVDRTFDTPLNLAENDLSLAFRTEHPESVALLVYLYDSADNWGVLELRDVTYRPPDIGWFRTSPGVFATSEDEPNLSVITRVRLTVRNTAERETTSWIDDLRIHEKADTGYVVLSWDDGFQNFYDHGAPLHDEYDLPAVIAYPPFAEASPGISFMTEAQLRERQDAGDEIISHASINERFSNVSPDRLEEKLQKNKRWLLDHDFDGTAFIVYPANDFDRAALDTVSKYHYMGGMNQSGSVNTTGVRGFDPLVLPRTIGHDLDIAKRAVRLAARHRQCTILNFHHFEKTHTMGVEEYEKLLQHITETPNVEAITFTDLWELRTRE
ncbi:polysaccharide deacetylase family protein [Haladaptatus sp. DJG-WS-42]|uniref:polysaccharide deacetylase family protein n=1 Tax=Haladaptatus sp. DJG-WS-42 TaxID=3120516 RepID=UPI0030CC5DB8